MRKTIQTSFYDNFSLDHDLNLKTQNTKKCSPLNCDVYLRLMKFMPLTELLISNSTSSDRVLCTPHRVLTGSAVQPRRVQGSVHSRITSWNPHFSMVVLPSVHETEAFQSDVSSAELSYSLSRIYRTEQPGTAESKRKRKRRWWYDGDDNYYNADGCDFRPGGRIFFYSKRPKAGKPN